MSRLSREERESRALEAKERGNAALSAGNYEDAIAHFSEGLSFDKRNAVLYSNRSAAHALAGQYEEALEDGRKAVALRPEWTKAHGRVGVALFNLQRYEESMQAYQAGLAVEPENAALLRGAEDARKALEASEYNVLGEEEITKRKYRNALDWFSKAVALHESNAVYWANRSTAHRLSGFAQEAQQDAQRAIQLRPQWFRGYQRLGEALMALGQYEQAMSPLAAALQMSDANSDELNSTFARCQQEMANAAKRAEYEAHNKPAQEPAVQQGAPPADVQQGVPPTRSPRGEVPEVDNVPKKKTRRGKIW